MQEAPIRRFSFLCHSSAPRRELERELHQRLPKFAQRRIQLIAHQNLRQAAMAGRFEQMWRSRDVQPYVQWKTIGDDRVRPAHRALHNLIWRIEEIPLWPPAGFNCRCWVIQLSERQLPPRAQIVRGPGTFTTPDGGKLKIRRVSDPGSYTLDGEAIDIDFTKPEPLMMRQLKAQKLTPEPPRTVEGFEIAAQEWQKKQRGKKAVVERLRYDQPHPNPNTLAWWNGKDINFTPTSSERLRLTLSKLSRGQALTVEETDWLADAYHELLHSLGDQDFSGNRKPSREFEIEIVNEMHTRLRLDRFIRDIGFNPTLAKTRDLITKGAGYSDWVSDMKAVLEALGVGRIEAAAFFENLNLKEKTTTYLERIIEMVAARLKLTPAEKTKLLADLKTELDSTRKIGNFRQEILRRAARSRIKPARW